MKNKEREENWLCITCDDGKSMTRGETLHHLQETHKINPPFTGKRMPVAHMDAAKSFTWVFEWEIGGMKLQQTTTESR